MQRQFRIESTEGLPIRGTLELPSTAPPALVIVIHGFKGFRAWGFFPWITEQLAFAGLAACRFDMSRNGVWSDDDRFDRLDLFADDTYSTQISDLNSVVTHLREHEGFAGLPVYLLGHSRGGAIALLGAASVPDLAGVITWSSIAHVDRWDAATIAAWRREGEMVVVNQRTGQPMRMSTKVLDDYDANRERLDVLRCASGLEVRLLVIHGDADESVPVAEARQLAGAARDASLVVIGGAGHTFGAIHPLVTVPAPLRLAMTLSRRFILKE